MLELDTCIQCCSCFIMKPFLFQKRMLFDNLYKTSPVFHEHHNAGDDEDPSNSTHDGNDDGLS